MRPGGDHPTWLHANRAREHGISLVEVIVVLAVVVTFASMAMPVTARVVEEGRARHAAAFVAAELRMARQKAVYTARAAGLVFDETTDGWTFRACVDGNSDGLRRADIRDAVDACGDARRLEVMFPGVAIALSATAHDPGEPASTDPVHFGTGDIASFSPEGSATAGTVYLRAKSGSAYAIKVANITGRTRLMKFDEGRRRWMPL